MCGPRAKWTGSSHRARCLIVSEHVIGKTSSSTSVIGMLTALTTVCSMVTSPGPVSPFSDNYLSMSVTSFASGHRPSPRCGREVTIGPFGATNDV